MQRALRCIGNVFFEGCPCIRVLVKNRILREKKNGNEPQRVFAHSTIKQGPKRNVFLDVTPGISMVAEQNKVAEQTKKLLSAYF